ncbi:selenocysteine-specific translation elongation factor [candidate division KSB1 bacterium]
MAHRIIGTAGHIDHGKTQLVKALTGTDTDRLKEEKEREITIDLGFAFLDDDLAFIDVPGHERFVKNMVAGVTGIDLALLVIAADDGIMPQTTEHIDILKLLNIEKLVVALTKTDLVDREWIDLVQEDIAKFLKTHGYDNTPVMPVSSLTGSGIDELRAVLKKETAQETARKTDRPFRMPIDRSFSMTGFGTVVTGTVITGSVGLRDKVVIYPQKKPVRIRGLQTHNVKTERLTAGERGAINIGGVQKNEIQRGDVLAHEGSLRASSNLNVYLHYLKSAENALLYHDRVRVHCGTTEVIGRIATLDREFVQPGERAPAQLQLEKPVAAAVGDRFIIRHYSPSFTIGGGEILECDTPRPRKNRKTIAEYIERILPLSTEEQIIALIEYKGLRAVSTKEIAEKYSLFPETVAGILTNREEQIAGIAEDDGEMIWISRSVFEAFLTRILNALDQYHTQNPSTPGIKRHNLVNLIKIRAEELIWKSAFDTLMNSGRITIVKERIKRAGFQPQILKGHEETEKLLLDLLTECGVKAPSYNEASERLGISVGELRIIVDVLADGEKLYVVENNLLYTAGEIERIKQMLVSHIRVHGQITLADFRSALQTSRKYALPLLNFYDDLGVTVRVGDERILK